MFKRMYGLPKNHGMFRPKLGEEKKQERRLYANSHSTEKLTYEPVLYCARPRKRPRPAERDEEKWRCGLDPVAMNRLFAIEKEIKEEKEEKKKEKEKEKQEEKEKEKEKDKDKEKEREKEKEKEKEKEEREEREAEREERERERAERERSRLDAAELERLQTECLLVKDVDLHVQENADKHHTDLFPCTEKIEAQLVIRRGQEFKMTLTFQRPWSSKDDDMHLIFKIGDEGNTAKGTYAKMKLEEGKDTSYMTKKDKDWGARIVSQDGNSLTLAVYVPPDVIIGEWEYFIRTVKEKGGESNMYDCEGDDDFVILLNPWCEDDQVYMKQTDDLKEYIDNETGLVFCGSWRSIQSKPWDYGQFHEGILESVLYILRKSNDYEISSNMNDAIYIARFLSRILNNCDDNGVLVGRWDGNYGDGERPTSWLGSADIIEKYLEKNPNEPVKYGQCWVFSHLFTTFARAVGLPCRSVTNFSSAHDTDLTMTIDKYVDDDGEEVGWKNGDSVWNFHVWNEVWINRPDLDKLTKEKHKYDGWHAVDATPQELSDSVFQCGPSPLAAIKEGDVHIGYDTKFIFAEVNAEYCNWKDGYPPSLISKDPTRVGRKISTKYPNGGSVGYYFGRDRGVRLDVTDLYKYAEGSAAERDVVEKATKKGKLGHLLFVDKSGIEITIDDPDEKTRIGQDVKIKAKVKNTSDKKQTVNLRLSVRPMNYWGGLLGKKKIVTKLFSNDTIHPGRTETYEVTADADDILALCDDSLSMKILAFCKINGESQPVFESEEMSIKAPGIRITGPGRKVSPDEIFEVDLLLKNPLPRKGLSGCELKLEGTIAVVEDGFTKKNSCFVKEIDDLKPGESRTINVKIKANPNPRRTKERKLNAGLKTKELPDFCGILDIELK